MCRDDSLRLTSEEIYKICDYATEAINGVGNKEIIPELLMIVSVCLHNAQLPTDGPLLGREKTEFENEHIPPNIKIRRVKVAAMIEVLREKEII